MGLESKFTKIVKKCIGEVFIYVLLSVLNSDNDHCWFFLEKNKHEYINGIQISFLRKKPKGLDLLP